MQDWETIRLRCVRDKEPIKVVARDMKRAPNTLRKYIRSQSAPERKAMVRAAKLDKFQSVIDDFLRSTPKITAKRIGDLLKRDYDVSLHVSESTLRKYVAHRRQQLIPREAFVRAEYQPADQAQFDFSPMRVEINGKEIFVEMFVMRLSFSGYFFARASVREDLPALMTGMVESFKFFGGMPRSTIFDNAKTAVIKIKPGRERIENKDFQKFRGELAIDVQFAAPRRGNEKGGVEGAHGFIEDNFFRPIPAFASISDLNKSLYAFCEKQLNRVHSTYRELIGDRFLREKPLLRPLPKRLPNTCVSSFAKINKFSEVVVKQNRYSVPEKYAYRDAFVDVGEETIKIRVGGEIIAEHTRCNGKRQARIDPLHYIDTIERKHRSAVTAAAFGSEYMPDTLLQLRDILIQKHGPTGTKKWMQIIRLAVDASLDEVANAARIGLARGAVDVDAIRFIMRQRSDTAEKVQVSSVSLAKSPQIVTLAAYQMNRFTDYAI